MNLHDILPHLDTLYTQCMATRLNVDNVRALLPKGSVLFGDDQALNQLDCVGDWKLVNAQLFTQVPFQQSRRRLEDLDKDKDSQDDPNPVQPERSRFILELLGRQNAAGVWVAKPLSELEQCENNLIEANFAQGRRVAFLTSERVDRSGRRGLSMVSVPRGCEVKELGRWVSQPPVSVPPIPMGRFGAGPRGPMRAAPPPRARLEMAYVLYEVVPKPRPAPPPALKPVPAKAPPRSPRRPSPRRPRQHAKVNL